MPVITSARLSLCLHDPGMMWLIVVLMTQAGMMLIKVLDTNA